jgi:hypothetical protein
MTQQGGRSYDSFGWGETMKRVIPTEGRRGPSGTEGRRGPSGGIYGAGLGGIALLLSP